MDMNRKHLMIMLACCLIPLAGLTIAILFDVPFNSIFFYGMLLLCPLLHVIMMRSMIGGRHEPTNHAQHNPPEEFPNLREETRQKRTLSR